MPAQVGADFFRVHAVPPVVAGAVFDGGDEGVRLAQDMEDPADEIDVGDFAAAADVVDVPVPAALKDEVYGPAVALGLKSVV